MGGIHSVSHETHFYISCELLLPFFDWQNGVVPDRFVYGRFGRSSDHVSGTHRMDLKPNRVLAHGSPHSTPAMNGMHKLTAEDALQSVVGDC